MAALKLQKGRQQRNSSEDPEEFRATLGEHLDELRTRIVRSVLLITAGWIIGWFLEPFVYTEISNLILRNLPTLQKLGPDYKEAFRSVTDPFMLKLKLSFFLGISMAFPFVALQFWGFVAPGLKPSERKPVKALFPASVVLFAIGCTFGWIVMPSAYQWFMSYLEDFPKTALFQEPGVLVFLTLKMMLAFGIGFQLPLIVFALGKIGILAPETLMSHWRHATVFIFIASAILTPSNDPFSMLMMAIPLSLLFMISVFAVRITSKKSSATLDELNDLDV